MTEDVKRSSKLHYHCLQVYISQELAIRQCCVLFHYSLTMLRNKILTEYFWDRQITVYLTNFLRIFDRNDIMLIGLKFSFLFLLSVLKLEVTFAIFQEGGKLRTSYFIIANNVIVFRVEVKTFFQYFNRNIIILIWIEMKMMNATLKFFEHWKFSKKCFTENELLFQSILFSGFFYDFVSRKLDVSGKNCFIFSFIDFRLLHEHKPKFFFNFAKVSAQCI